MRVPGAFDLPLVAREIAESGPRRRDHRARRGDSRRDAHFESSPPPARGLSRVAEETGVPVTFGVLTTSTRTGRRARADGREPRRRCGGSSDPARIAGTAARESEHEQSRSPERGPAREARPASCSRRRSISASSADRHGRRLGAQYGRDPNFARADAAYFRAALEASARARKSWTGSCARHSDIGPSRLDPVEHAMLRLGLWELISQPASRTGSSSTKPSTSRSASARPTATVT